MFADLSYLFDANLFVLEFGGFCVIRGVSLHVLGEGIASCVNLNIPGDSYSSLLSKIQITKQAEKGSTVNSMEGCTRTVRTADFEAPDRWRAPR